MNTSVERYTPPPHKHILDACCGSRMFWFDKSNPAVVFVDIRRHEGTLCDGRQLSVVPDLVADFRNLPFVDESFSLVVFDPPHLNQLGQTSWMAQKYGVLFSTWETDIRAGVDECMRVLKPQGTLIFKWNESQIKTSTILSLIGRQPLFGHPSGKGGKTHWMAFMKGIPNVTTP